MPEPSWQPCRVRTRAGSGSSMVSRAQRTPFGDWWWTVDRLLLGALAALMLAGIVLSLAASPPVAARLGLDPFHFVNRQVAVPAAGDRRAAGGLVPVAAPDPARRARRVPASACCWSRRRRSSAPRSRARGAGWSSLGVNVQPSEFLKPAFVILIAWLFARIGAAAGDAGQHHRARAAAARSSRCWCCSPTSARPC